MHEHAELGVAAHWRYKEGGPNDPAFDRKVAVMRQLLDAGEDRLDDETLLESFQSATSEDRVYALTPKGQVIDLTLGATVLDFAYHVHTEVGHHCRGAKVNGRIVPLTYQLATGERVEILTGKEPRPSRDWLNPRLGFIHGARARAKVRHWYKREGHDEHLRQGRELVESELKRMGLAVADLDGVPARFQYRSLEDLFAAVGNGDLAVAQVASAAERLRNDRERPDDDGLVVRKPKADPGAANRRVSDVTIEGVGGLMTNMARCCQPLPGDPVVGYITRGRGVTIHRDDCRNVLRWQAEDSQRLLQVRWGARPEARYRAGVLIRAFNRRELFKDISSALASADINVTDMSSRPWGKGDETEIRLHLQVRTYEQLSELLTRLGSIRNVMEVSRLREKSQLP
jgi:GTP pyrophosphokinase